MSSSDGSDEQGQVDGQATQVDRFDEGRSTQGANAPQRGRRSPDASQPIVGEQTSPAVHHARAGDDAAPVPAHPSGAYEQVAGPEDPTPPPTSGAYHKVAGPEDPTPPPTSGAYHKVAGPEDPTPPPTSGAYQKVTGPDEPTPPPTTSGAYAQIAGPDEPTPPPTTSGAYAQVAGADEPTPPPTTSGAYAQVLGADDPTPPPTTTKGPPAQGRAVGDAQRTGGAEQLSSTGFIPGTSFKATDDDRSKTSRRVSSARGITIAGRTFTLPSLTWLDDADNLRRVQYGGVGLVAGVIVGGVLGVLNALLQGWSVAEGASQLLGLAATVGIICAVMAALRPNRVERIVEKFGIDN